MSLPIGTRLGLYEIVAPIGAGGMGEVYRARDTTLDRDVALKILPASFATDPDRLMRFTREAKTLASLNHPNIAAIYGIEGTALVMELVEGRDLSELIGGAKAPPYVPMVLADALRIASQILDALEAAHEQGIVHRDLKPANIKVRDDGTVKVLDFGLAKAMDPAGASSADMANSPTMTSPAMTEKGMILGTAAYMSPEQARGRAVDKRTDVWAFGCVLYEMLSGRRAFTGNDATEIIAAVIKTEPDWQALPASLPAHVRTIVMRCLVKDRKTRIPDLAVVRFLLDGSLAAAASVSTPIAPTSRVQRLLPWAVAGLLGIVALLMWAPWRTPTQPAAARFLITASDTMKFSSGTAPIISPDGRTLVFTALGASGTPVLWVRPIDSLIAQPLAGTEAAQWPFWSADSRTIGFSLSGKLMKIAATGGPLVTICALGPNIGARGASWNRDGVIVFNNGPATLYRVSPGEGTASPMGALTPGEIGRQFPWFLPDGRHVLYHSVGSPGQTGVYATSLDTPGESQRILSSDTGAVYDSKSGHLLFARQGTLMAQVFDPNTFTMSGDAFPIAERVIVPFGVPGGVGFTVSETGALAYGVRGDVADVAFELVWVDRQGKKTGTVGPPGNYRGVDLSPNGSKVATHRHDADGGDIWVTDIPLGTTSRFTFDAAQDNASPAWSPDGNRIAFSSIRSGKAGVYVKNANKTGDDVQLFESKTDAIEGFMGPQPQSWAADGLSVLFEAFSGTTTWRDLWLLPTSGDRKPAALLNGPDEEKHGQFSPDGKWVAYHSSGSSIGDIYVRPATATGGKWAASTGGGRIPRWRGDSRELFYMAGAKMMAVAVTSNGDAFESGTPTPLFDHGNTSASHADYFPYAVTKDGQRFLISRPVSAAARAPAAAPPSSPIVVVLNWIEAIKK